MPLQVEVIMVERNAAGQSAGQFSIGWAQLPLFADAARLSAMPGNQAAAAPLMSGTPRYLLFRWAAEQSWCTATWLCYKCVFARRRVAACC
jgi:hypothetical protein